MSDDDIRVCDECGASVYKEHIKNGIARYEGNKLLCSHCIIEHDKKHESDLGSGAGSFEPIELDNLDDSASSEIEMSSSQIHQAEDTRGKASRDAEFKRPLDPKATGASRCRTFHCRISDGAIDFLNNQLNEWLDQNPEITIKFSNTVIGMFEGKHTEPNIITTVFY